MKFFRKVDFEIGYIKIILILHVFFCHLVSTGKKIKGVLSENDHVSINDIPAIKPEEHG